MLQAECVECRRHERDFRVKSVGSLRFCEEFCFVRVLVEYFGQFKRMGSCWPLLTFHSLREHLVHSVWCKYCVASRSSLSMIAFFFAVVWCELN